MSRRGWLLFSAMCVIWGVPYLFIKVSVEHMSPVFLVFLRTTGGALILLPIAAARGQLRALLPHWRAVLAYTAVEVTAPWLLLSHAETRLTSSLTGLLLAAVPIVAVVLGRVSGDSERLGAVRLLGLLVGIGGVAALVGLDVHGGDAVALGEIGLTALGYATGPLIVTRRLAHLPSTGVIATSLVVSAVICAPWALTDVPAGLPATAIWSVVMLALVCTAVAFVVFFALIGEVGPARATVITYVNPAVAVLLGVVVLSEPFTVGTAIGFPLVLAGSYLATRRTAKPQQRADTPEAHLAAQTRSLTST